MPLAYTISNGVFRGLLKVLSQWKVVGKEAVPPKGPLLVVSNHLSNVDPALLAVSLPRRLHFMAKRGIFKGPVVGAFLRAYGAHPLNRDGHDVAAMRWSLRLLQEEGVLVVFPEGTRSPEGLMPGLPGVAMLAIRSQAPILPVAITGTEHLRGLLRLTCPTGKLTVTIGDPFSLPPIEGKLERPQLQSFTDLIMLRLAALLPEERRGVYRTGAPRGSAHA
ncbi:MAG: 1-acyl-sn-glycerol-3-phosphate acyltransferase [Dehalococcoidia bacterium]|nr:1-acyl-sn-glycerol-3-phosphate acyltransferase [Dehalococcoidia bacterium]